jgi:hypothetical protein
LRDEIAYAVPELAGDLRGSDEFQGHDVEQVPIDRLERYRGVGDLAAEALAHRRHDGVQERAEAGVDVGEPFAPAVRVGQQAIEPFLEAVPWSSSTPIRVTTRVPRC